VVWLENCEHITAVQIMWKSQAFDANVCKLFTIQ